MPRYGFSPDGLHDPENYRGIALSSILGKLFDSVVCMQNHDVLKSSDLQYGFKSEHAPTMCSFAVKEVLQYYVKKPMCVCYDARCEQGFRSSVISEVV